MSKHRLKPSSPGAYSEALLGLLESVEAMESKRGRRGIAKLQEKTGLRGLERDFSRVLRSAVLVTAAFREMA